MDQSSVEAKFTLRLVVDEKKKKVLFAEACRDFVDVLFSFLTLPMGTIVRLLEQHRKSETLTVGCFSNLYKSVVDMSIDDFETEACRQMLLYPSSTREVQCKRLKINLHPTEGGKYFICPTFSRCKMCSNFSTSRCKCGMLMNRESQLSEKNVEVNKQNGVFVRGKSSFIITDDLQVAVRSTNLVLEKLKSQGCGDFRKVGERLVDIGFEEVLTLLQCIFSSNAPLTDTFLNKHCPKDATKTCETLGPFMKRKRDESEPEPEPEEVLTLSVIMRKQGMKILYAECGQDFVDLLFTFLAVPLESIMDISGNSSTYGCIRNLFRSFKDLSATEVSTHKSVLPHYYRCKKQLLSIITEQPMKLHITSSGEPMVLIDPKSHAKDHSTDDKGFVNRDTKFTVTDDLIIIPMNSSSALSLLKKLQIQAKDLEVQEIKITKTEAASLLRASLMTTSGLNTALGHLTLKKPKEET